MKSTLAMAALLTTLTTLTILCPHASADRLGSRENQYGVITVIDKGAKQIGFDGILTLTSTKEADTSFMRANVLASGLFRFFVKDNLGVSIRLGGLMRKSGDARDLGAVGALWANYYVRISDGMFFAPGAGAGMLFAERTVPIDDTTSTRSNLVGFVGAAEFPMQFFINRKWSLKAGPEFMLSTGGNQPDTGESTTFLAIDGGFKVGIELSF